MDESMKRLVKFFASFGTAALLFISNIAFAQEGPRTGIAEPWETGMQKAASPIADQAHDFWHLLFIIIAAICVMVLLLLAFVIVKFRAKANPVPSKVTHNTLIEVVWTILPVVILLIIFIPSMRLLYSSDRVEDADLTIKAIGNQWYWEYEYPDQGFSYLSNMVADEDLEPGQPRLLTTDEQVVVPVGANVRLLTTSNDVIHSWAIPSFYVKLDAVPGRLNETWFRAEEEGTYYGQCSELCGIRHGFMPIEVKVVSRQEFNSWIRTMQTEYGALEGDQNIKLAAADIEAR
jgi:cytochrome c oxidase subunit 2